MLTTIPHVLRLLTRPKRATITPEQRWTIVLCAYLGWLFSCLPLPAITLFFWVWPSTGGIGVVHADCPAPKSFASGIALGLRSVFRSVRADSVFAGSAADADGAFGFEASPELLLVAREPTYSVRTYLVWPAD